MKMNIRVYFFIEWQIINNNFSPFRDLCLETVLRFINHRDKCEFNLSTAEDILQDGRLIIIMLVIVT